MFMGTTFKKEKKEEERLDETRSIILVNWLGNIHLLRNNINQMIYRIKNIFNFIALINSSSECVIRVIYFVSGLNL